ncbi:hypothetical protein GCK32_005639 [Trichostrongylus colubriformis]|uniref:Uncharacterized protein n=1 Tax=Trichostrongylus colubriformis TaxID=6319 RepID=A0AAN8IMH4_TRICO
MKVSRFQLTVVCLLCGLLVTTVQGDTTQADAGSEAPATTLAGGTAGETSAAGDSQNASAIASPDGPGEATSNAPAGTGGTGETEGGTQAGTEGGTVAAQTDGDSGTKETEGKTELLTNAPPQPPRQQVAPDNKKPTKKGAQSIALSMGLGTAMLMVALHY